MNKRKYLLGTCITMVLAVAILLAAAYTSISLRAKQFSSGNLNTSEIEKVERRMIEKVSPGAMEIPWKAIISFFK